MSGNTFGTIFKLTTFGESHGLAMGAIVDGCPPNIELSEEIIQEELDRRKPGQSKHAHKEEPDRVEHYLEFSKQNNRDSNWPFNQNTDQKSKDYEDIKDKLRPGHADYTYFKKYGIRDYRGGGRASARNCNACCWRST